MGGMEIVFSTPDVAEAERTRKLLDDRGLTTAMAYGPDPVTGMGGAVFGGAGGLIYNVSVEDADADAAREAIASRETHDPVPEEHPFETKPSSWSAPLRRLGRPFFILFFLMSLVVFVTMGPILDEWLGAVPALVILVVLVLARWR